MNERETALEILHELESAGFEAVLVGGCVRDMVLGVEPHDFDVATNALPEQVQEVFPNSPFVGESFGVVLVRGVEVATFRTDHNHDGRHCDVSFADVSLEEDLARRDFTFNAMAMDLRGNLFDPFDGQADLEAGVVRFVGSAVHRLREDFCRALRAVRFADRFGFELADDTLEAIRAAAPLVTEHVAPERIFVEFEKALS
jgi:tRNA nucleotidyltransferase (CCA-adding enzyme)